MNNPTHQKVITLFFSGLALMAVVEMGLIWFFERSFSGSWWQNLLGLGMTLAGAALVIWSVRTLYRQGKGTPAPMAATQWLVRSGPYRYSRNPMTLGAGVFYLGLAAWAGSWIVFGLVLLIFISLLTFIYIHESRELAARFGVEYLQYKKEVPFLLPRLPR